MKRLLYIPLLILIISCNNTGKTNEKFQYERVKEDNTSIPANNMVSNNVILNSNDQMKFDKKIIKVNSGQEVTLRLNPTGRFPVTSMGHNFVLIKKDVDINQYALKAAGARNNDYIQDGGNEIVYTKMLGGGESDTITFNPPEPGVYTFICTFPGHYMLMMGEFHVI